MADEAPTTEPADAAAAPPSKEDGDAPAKKAPEAAADPVRRDGPEKPVTRPAPVAIPSEDELDSPSWLTLGLLAAIFAVTVGSWGAARFACNMHPPESRGAPKLATDRLLVTPKDAAIEFIQRFRSSDFDGALETVTGDLTGEVARGKEDCSKRENECARQREAAAGRLTTAIVSKQDGFVAETHVTTTLKGVTEKYVVMTKRDNTIWKAASMTRE